MQKRIGILTFHNVVNYGAILQVFALYRVLIDEGFSVEVIDYINDKINDELKSKGQVNRKGIIANAKGILQKYHGLRKYNSFSKFLSNNIKLSSERNINKSSVQKQADSYDVFVTGSDQVWNLSLTNHDMTYFLDFVSDKAVKIAYAVSGGDYGDEGIKSTASLLNRFRSISVREEFFGKFLKENCGVESNICCDPVFLADNSEFLKVKSKRLIRKKYIFCFLMGNKPGIMEIARSIAAEKNLKIIDNKSSMEFFLHSSPNDFLSWIYNAEYVLTDSFHGTAFSLIFKKQFVSDKYDENGQLKLRIGDLLDSLDIKERFESITSENACAIRELLYTQIDYEKVEELIKAISKESHNWLIDSITE